MSSRLRSLDSKISFFAFADIITAVSGVLIFVALLLATDLGRPTDSHSQAANTAGERQLQEILARQVAVDAENHRLTELLAAATAAPDLNQLQADLAALRVQLAQEQKKSASLADQVAGSQAAMNARDRLLGLTDLKADLQRAAQETEAVARQDAKARGEMDNLEQQVAHVESQLLKLRQREGQLWLIPDKNTTTKEPILVTVAGAGAAVERFDHPADRQQWDKSGAVNAFKTYLGQAKALNQYVVFLVRPSGIGLFQDLVKTARDLGFEVGYDALEEDRQIHFSTPPPIDEPAATAVPAAGPAQTTTTATNSGFAPAGHAAPAEAAASPTNRPPPAVTPAASAPAKAKSWWQKLLEWLGFK